MTAATVVVAASLAWSVLATRSVEDASNTPDSEADGAAHADSPATVSIPPDAPAFPGVSSATDADLGDSVWFVLDGRGHRVHRFGASGELLGSFAREGEGPGELARPSAVVVHHDTVVVADRQTLHLYAPSGAHIADRTVFLDNCFGLGIDDIDSVAGGLLLLADCVNSSAGQVATVFLETQDGRVERVAAHSPGGRGRVLDFGRAPVVSAVADGFVFGDAQSECLDRFDAGARAEPQGSVCHDWLPRLPVTAEERKATEEELEDVAASVGLRVEMPRNLPPFDRVFALEGDRLAYRALARDADGEVSAYRLVVRGEAGDALPLPAPVAPTVFASGESALAAWEALDAMHVAVYSLKGS